MKTSNHEGWVFLSTIQKIHPTSHLLKLRSLDENIFFPTEARIGVDPEFGIPCTIKTRQEKWLEIKGWQNLEQEDLNRLVGLDLWLPKKSLAMPLWNSFLGLALEDTLGNTIGETSHFSFGQNQTFLKVTTNQQKIDLPLVSEQFEIYYEKGELKKIICKLLKSDLEDIYGEL